MAREIFLEKVYHRGENRILIRFEYNKEFTTIVKTLADCRWSQTYKCWHVPNNPESLKRIFASFKGIVYVNSDGVFKKKAQIKKSDIKSREKPELPSDIEDAILELNEYMLFKRYSINTIKTYIDVVDNVNKMLYQ